MADLRSRTGTRLTIRPAAFAAVALGFLSCVFDGPTEPGKDLASMQFEVTGDSRLMIGDTLRLTATSPSGQGGDRTEPHLLDIE